MIWQFLISEIEGCLVMLFKQQFSVFKHHNTYFTTFFNPHVFLQHLNNVIKNLLRGSFVNSSLSFVS